MIARREHRRPRQAVVLAAGDGTRLRPLTDRVPKPLLPIDGQPVLGRVLTQLAANDIEDAWIVVGYRGEVIRRFLDEQSFDLNLHVVDQQPRNGSGHALQLTRSAGLPARATVVMASDTWWEDSEVEGFIERAAQDMESVATMALLRWPIAALPGGYAVQVDTASRVQRVLYRDATPGEHGITTALAGSPLYVLHGELWARIDALGGAEGDVIQLADALQRAIDEGHVVRGFEFSQARDLTGPGDLLRHNFPYLQSILDADRSEST